MWSYPSRLPEAEVFKTLPKDVRDCWQTLNSGSASESPLLHYNEEACMHYLQRMRAAYRERARRIAKAGKHFGAGQRR